MSSNTYGQAQDLRALHVRVPSKDEEEIAEDPADKLFGNH